MSDGHERYDADLSNYDWLQNEIVIHESGQADALGKLILSKFGPKDVIDVGCGPGIYLKPFEQAGCDVFGVDGAPAAGKYLRPDQFAIVDLRQPYYPPRYFDLALCIEVAEHLKPEYADTLIDTIVRCAPLVFFSAARVGQNGEGHFNCQDRPYWIEKFEKRGFVHDAGLTSALHEVIDVESVYESCWWLRWNGMVLRKA